jgi:hypothetical protein
VVGTEPARLLHFAAAADAGPEKGCPLRGWLSEHESTLRRPTLVQTPPQGAGLRYQNLSNTSSSQPHRTCHPRRRHTRRHRCHPQVHGRSPAGASQVSQRSAEADEHRPAGSWSIRGQSLRSAAHAQITNRGLLPGVVSPEPYPDITRLSRLPVDSVGRTLDRPVILREPGGLTAEGSGASKAQSQRFGEPLAPPRFRPPYVRNHCYAAAHSGTS